MSIIIEIGNIGTYYGGLLIKELNSKYYWGIKNYDGTDYEEIPKSLYDELISYNNSIKKEE